MSAKAFLEGIPDIHSCSHMMIENAQLRKKLHKIRSENCILKKELDQIREKMKVEKLMKDYVTTRNMETQTESVKSCQQTTSISKSSQKNAQKESSAQTNKLVAMHNALMRRYENELKKSMQHVENITELQLQVNDLEQKLKRAEFRTQELESKKRYNRASSSGRRNSIDRTSDEEDRIGQLKRELTKVKKEKASLAVENRRVKSELKGLDEGFFEEIEDLKYALQLSADLNQRYERSLRKICAKYGQPYPHPEKAPNNV